MYPIILVLTSYRTACMPLHAASMATSEVASMMKMVSDADVDMFEQFILSKNSETVLSYLETPLSDNAIDPFTGLPISELSAESFVELTAELLANDVIDTSIGVS